MLKFILLVTLSMLFSAPISNNQANTVTQNVFIEFSNQNIDDLDVNYVQIINVNNIDIIYIYHLSPQGFIIISADDNSYPVIGYSFDNNFLTDNLPDNFNWAFNTIKSNIYTNINSITPRTNEISQTYHYLTITYYTPSLSHKLVTRKTQVVSSYIINHILRH